MKSYLIYDCEIVKLIPPRDGVRLDGYEYCRDWSDHESMGISVIGFYSSRTNKIDHWLDGPDYSIRDLAEFFARHNHLIGFNSKGFDDKLMTANGVQITTTYDLLEEVRIAAGFGPDYRSVPKGFSYSLDSIAKANGMAKSGSGELAPMLWQQGKHQEVIDYAMHDVRITHELLKLGLAGQLVDPNTCRFLQLRDL